MLKKSLVFRKSLSIINTNSGDLEEDGMTMSRRVLENGEWEYGMD
jgi:hypothetical protein